MEVKGLIIISCIILGVLGKVMTHRWINPMTALSWMWSVIFFLASLELFSLKEAQDRSYLLMFLGVFAYSIGFIVTYIIFKKRHFVIRKQNKCFSKNEWITNYRILYVLGAVVILYFFISFLKIINVYISGNGLAQVRLIAQTRTEVTGGIVSKVMNAFRILVVIPYSLAIVPVTAADFWLGKRDKKLLIICIATIGLRILSEGGRINLLYLFVDLFIGFTYATVKIKRERNDRLARLFKKSKRIMRGLCITIIAVLIVASLSRAGDNLKRFTYYYFAMEPYMFETWSNTVDLNHVYGYGVASFNGFAFVLLYLIKNVLGISFPEHFNSVYQMILDSDAQWQIITTKMGRANAYVSAFWYFYLDGRLAGIIIMGMIYGIIMAVFFLKVTKNTNAKSVAMYCFAFQSVYMTFSGFSFASVYYCVAFIMLITFSFKKGVRSVHE